MIPLSDLKKQILEALVLLNPEKIMLFGSYVYGTPNEDSDIDICVVEKGYGSVYKDINEKGLVLWNS